MKGISVRRTISLGNGTSVNIGLKKTSVTKKIGNMTISSNGNLSIRLGKGLTYHMKLK